MNKLFLNIVMLPSGMWKGMGANTDQLRAILDTKLKLDDRKPLSFGRRQQKKNARFNSFRNMLMSGLMGVFSVFLLFSFTDPIFRLFGYYTAFLFVLTFTLITDFSTVVTDTRDKFILLPRPINDRTLFLSRMLHILIYLFRIIIPMSLPGWIAVGLLFGTKAVLLFPLPLLLMTFIALFLVNGCYLLILRLASPGRFQDIINTFQIVFSISVFVFYYTLQPILRKASVRDLDPHHFSWIRALPSYWLAACFSWVGVPASLPYTVQLGFVAIAFPLLSLWVTVRWLAPQFAYRIGAIDAIETPRPSATTKRTGKVRFYEKLANLVNKRETAKAGFIITWLQTSRSRTFKMRVYPSLVYVPVYFFYLLLMREESFAEVWASLPQSKTYLVFLYMSSFALMNAMNYVTMSDQYKAAWVYYAAPVEKPGHVMAGAFKAIWLKYFLPFISFLGAFAVWVWGPGAILDVLLATVNVSLFAVGAMYISFRVFPFSIMENMKTTGGKTFVRIILTLALVGILGTGHYFATFFWWLKLIFLVLSSILFWMVWDSYRNTDWKNLKITLQDN